MSLLTVLKTIGKDLKDVGGWIDDGLKVITPIVEIVDPPIGMILSAIENALTGLSPTVTTTSSPATITLTTKELQAIITALATVTVVQHAGYTKSLQTTFKPAPIGS